MSVRPTRQPRTGGQAPETSLRGAVSQTRAVVFLWGQWGGRRRALFTELSHRLDSEQVAVPARGGRSEAEAGHCLLLPRAVAALLGGQGLSPTGSGKDIPPRLHPVSPARNTKFQTLCEVPIGERVTLGASACRTVSHEMTSPSSNLGLEFYNRRPIDCFHLICFRYVILRVEGWDQGAGSQGGEGGV